MYALSVSSSVDGGDENTEDGLVVGTDEDTDEGMAVGSDVGDKVAAVAFGNVNSPLSSKDSFRVDLLIQQFSTPDPKELQVPSGTFFVPSKHEQQSSH